MSRNRIFRLALDLTDEERQQLAEAAALSGERFVDFVRRLAIEGARASHADVRLETRRLA